MGTKPALSLTLDLSSILFGSREGAPTGGKATSKVTPTLSQAGAGTARAVECIAALRPGLSIHRHSAYCSQAECCFSELGLSFLF